MHTHSQTVVVLTSTLFFSQAYCPAACPVCVWLLFVVVLVIIYMGRREISCCNCGTPLKQNPKTPIPNPPAPTPKQDAVQVLAITQAQIQWYTDAECPSVCVCLQVVGPKFWFINANTEQVIPPATATSSSLPHFRNFPQEAAVTFGWQTSPGSEESATQVAINISVQFIFEILHFLTGRETRTRTTPRPQILAQLAPRYNHSFARNSPAPTTHTIMICVLLNAQSPTNFEHYAKRKVSKFQCGNASSNN